MSKIDVNTIAQFSWNFEQEFFLQTSEGNYIWSDPDYGGDHTIRKFDGSLEDYLGDHFTSYVRDKGVHRIGDWCGLDVKFEDS